MPAKSKVYVFGPLTQVLGPCTSLPSCRNKFFQSLLWGTVEGETLNATKFQLRITYNSIYVVRKPLTSNLKLVTKTIIVITQTTYTGWPKKVSHYRESSLNRIKNRQPG